MSKKTETLKIDLKDQIVKTPIKDMIPGNIMYTTPESMVVTKSGECWLLPSEFVISDPNPIQEVVMGVIKDIDGKYIVFGRNLGFHWEPIRKPQVPLLPIKELRDIAIEVIESQQVYEETYFSSGNEDEDEEGMST